MTKKNNRVVHFCVYGRIIQDNNNNNNNNSILIYCYQNSDTVITVKKKKNMAIEYVMLFTTKQTKQECIHIHAIKLMMVMKRDRQRKTGEKNSLSGT